jgi:hypothetical protein
MTGRILLIVALAGLLSGCQGSGGPLFSYNSNMSSLKTSVSQLEFRNEELSKQVATLKSENRHYQDRLVQEQTENDTLATQLNDAKGLLGMRGNGSSDIDAPTGQPKVRRSKATHRPPAAAIPGQLDPAPASPAGPDSGDVGAWKPAGSSTLAVRSNDRWLPVAQGVGSGQSTVK